MNVNREVAIIIPAYNSAKTIVALVKEILQILPLCSIYIVEDSSPDGTGKVIRNTFKKNRDVNLFVRKTKSGRGSAVIFGLKQAQKDPRINSFIEMDADFYHDPSSLPALIRAGKEKNVVIASRYIKGSKIIGWTKKRRIFSKVANSWAGFLLRLPIHDYTNGYRLYNRKAVQLITNHHFKARGFAVLSEILFCLAKEKISFGEIPTTVTYNETYGSNFSLQEISEAFLTILLLRFFSWD